ncbi:MAG: enoyl-CoA hydratase/isomerase family protein [Ilumatobacteraceae bacterium]
MPSSSAAPEFDCLRVSVDGPIGRLELHRPERLNALSRHHLRELTAAARWFDTRPNVKVVGVTGAGRSFCAGFDLGDFADPDPGVPMRDVADLGRIMAEAVTGMRALTVVGIQGNCVGGGLVLAAACDQRVAAADAVFSIPEVELGIPLAWAGIPRLVREIGPALTKELVLTCRRFSPAEAAASGFLNRVVAAAELTATVDELLGVLASRSALTLTATKGHVNAVAEEMASTASGRRDGDILVSALHDPESRAVGQAYLERRRARSSPDAPSGA